VYHHYFKEDIQQGIHSPMVDAKATMKLFKEAYCPLQKLKDVASKMYWIGLDLMK